MKFRIPRWKFQIPYLTESNFHQEFLDLIDRSKKKTITTTCPITGVHLTVKPNGWVQAVGYATGGRDLQKFKDLHDLN